MGGDGEDPGVNGSSTSATTTQSTVSGPPSASTSVNLTTRSSLGNGTTIGVGTSDWMGSTVADPTDCEGLNFMGECVSSVQEYVSFVVGIIAVLLWLWANYQFLQAKKKQGDAASGHIIYVIHLILADSSNLLGAVLCDQLGTQILTAILLVVCDAIFVFLLMHNCRHRRAEEQLNNNWNSKNATKTSNGSILPVCCLLLPWALTFAAQPIRSLHSGGVFVHAEEGPLIGCKLLMVTDSPVDNFGFALGVVSALLYATVRLVTIKDSIYRKDLIRQEMSFHTLASLASMLYCISILLYSVDGAYIINALPWLCGIAILGVEDLFIVFMAWRFAPPKIRASYVDDDAMLLSTGGDGSSVNLEADDRPHSAPQGASVVHERRSPFHKKKPYLEVAEKDRSDTICTEVSYLSDDRRGSHMSDSTNQREVQVQIVSHPVLQTAGPEEDLFMNQQNLRPSTNQDYEDEFEWDFSDINHQYGSSGRDDGWDEEKILKEIEDELKKAGSEDSDRASTPSLSYGGHHGSHEDLSQAAAMETVSLT